MSGSIDLLQSGLKKYENKIFFLSEQEGTINFVRGYCNEILSLLEDKYMNKEQIINEIGKLRDMSLREDMNEHINMQSRRNQAQKLILLLDNIKCDLEENDYLNIKSTLKKFLFENFTRQILPEKSGVIGKAGLKNENYLNRNDIIGKKVLEPREYIGIIPEAYSDLDSPSIVTALTPPNYTQGEHSHENNYEITFYAGESIAKYRDNGELVELNPKFGDFVIFPPNTIHTIHNPLDTPVMNISIKLPSALLDRGENIDKRSGKGELRSMKKTRINGVYRGDFDKVDVPYSIKIYNFSEIENFEIFLDGEGKKACYYVIKGNFIGDFSGKKKIHALTEGSTVILDKDDIFSIQDVNGDGIIYGVLLDY